MKKYFYLQAKLTARYLPFVLAVSLALALGMGIVMTGVMSFFENDGSRKDFAVAVTGDTDNLYLQWGISALQTIQEENFSVQIMEMERSQAHMALEKGQIHAYVMIPDGFMENALQGDVEPITYVTSAGMEGVSALLKREITKLVTNIVVYSQKGTYGLLDALTEHGVTDDAYTHMSVLCLEYTDLILHRDAVSNVTELGVSDGLTLLEYYTCAGLVILLSLMGIPFASLYIKQDYTLSRLLASQGISHGKQLLCEYGGHLLGMLAVGLVLLFGVGSVEVWEAVGVKVFTVIIMLAAMNLLIFNLSGNVISGLLLHFAGTVALCYVSGCIYPATAFPVSVQNVAAWLPTGIARQYLAAGFTSAPAWGVLAALLAYSAAFFGLALLVRYYKAARIER